MQRGTLHPGCPWGFFQLTLGTVLLCPVLEDMGAVPEPTQVQPGTADCDTEDVHPEGACVREAWGGRPPGGEARHGQGRVRGTVTAQSCRSPWERGVGYGLRALGVRAHTGDGGGCSSHLLPQTRPDPCGPGRALLSMDNKQWTATAAPRRGCEPTRFSLFSSG